MAIEIKEDVTSGMKYSFDKDGGQLDRRFSVSGLPGPTGSSQSLYLATVAQDAVTGIGIPRYGQSHPTIPGLFCQKVESVPLAGTSRIAAMVTCHYGWQSFSLGQIQITITGTRNVLHANRDPATHQPFIVTYKSPAGAAGGGAAGAGGGGGPSPAIFSVIINDAVAPKISRQLCEFNISTFHLVLKVQRVETSSPKTKAAAFAGKVNIEPGWQGVGGGQSRLWMCQSIEGTIMQNGWYNVTYVFEFAPEGWWQVGLYTNPADHQIPSDIFNTDVTQLIQVSTTGQIANGQFLYVPFPAAFSALNIPLV